jgi:hypothetical protein
MNKSMQRLCIAGPATLALGAVLALGSATMLTGCEGDSAEETVEDAADATGDAVDDAADAVDDAADDAGDAIDDATD